MEFAVYSHSHYKLEQSIKILYGILIGSQPDHACHRLEIPNGFGAIQKQQEEAYYAMYLAFKILEKSANCFVWS